MKFRFSVKSYSCLIIKRVIDSFSLFLKVAQHATKAKLNTKETDFVSVTKLHNLKKLIFVLHGIFCRQREWSGNKKPRDKYRYAHCKSKWTHPEHQQQTIISPLFSKSVLRFSAVFNVRCSVGRLNYPTQQTTGQTVLTFVNFVGPKSKQYFKT